MSTSAKKDDSNPAGLDPVSPFRTTPAADQLTPVINDAELVVDTPWREQSGQLPGGGDGHNGKDFMGRPIGSWNRFGNR